MNASGTLSPTLSTLRVSRRHTLPAIASLIRSSTKPSHSPVVYNAYRVTYQLYSGSYGFTARPPGDTRHDLSIRRHPDAQHYVLRIPRTCCYRAPYYKYPQMEDSHFFGEHRGNRIRVCVWSGRHLLSSMCISSD